MAKGERIKWLREKMGYSQTELAERVNISKQTLYKYENNIITNVPSDIIEKIASVLDCPPGYFMGWEEAEPLDDPALFEVEWRKRGGAAHSLILTKEEEDFILEARTIKGVDPDLLKRMMVYIKALKEANHANS